MLILLLKIIGGVMSFITILGLGILLFGERIMFAYRVDGGLEHAKRYVNDSTTREIIFIPMIHLNTESFYDKLREYLDDMKQQGYVTFSEGVFQTDRYSDTTRYITRGEASILYASKNCANSMTLHELKLKERRIINQNPPDWTDSIRLIDKSMKKLYRNPKYKGQTSQLLGTITEQDYWADYTLADLIRLYEKEWGKVVLTKYDYETPMLEYYNRYKNTCAGDTIAYCRSAFISFYRNHYLQKKFIEADFPKIIVIYGADHIGIVRLGLGKYGFYEDRDFKVPKKYR